MISMCSMPRKPQRKPKPSASDTFRFVKQRRIVQRQFRQRFAKRFVIFGGNREQARIHLRLHFLETGQRFDIGRARDMRDRIADRRAVNILDAGDDEAHFAGVEAIRFGHVSA